MLIIGLLGFSPGLCLLNKTYLKFKGTSEPFFLSHCNLGDDTETQWEHAEFYVHKSSAMDFVISKFLYTVYPYMSLPVSFVTKPQKMGQK